MSNNNEESLEEDDVQVAIEGDKPLLRQYAGQALTLSQVAQILKVAPVTVRKWCENGLVEAFQLPSLPGSRRRHWRVRGRSIDRILEQQEEKPKE